MSRLSLAMLGVLFFPIPSMAYEPDSALMTDYIGLSKALRANGVEPVLVKWPVIESMCLGLKTQKDQIIYNQCRFDAALNQVTFDDDRRSCLDDAERATTQSSVSVTATNATVMQQTQSVPSSYSSCMRGLGWRSPNNWQRGRFTSETK